MTINRPSFGTTSASSPSKLSIRMLDTRPILLARLAEPVIPGEIAGYFDPNFQVVELFMADPTAGAFWLRIGS